MAGRAVRCRLPVRRILKCRGENLVCRLTSDISGDKYFSNDASKAEKEMRAMRRIRFKTYSRPTELTDDVKLMVTNLLQDDIDSHVSADPRYGRIFIHKSRRKGISGKNSAPIRRNRISVYIDVDVTLIDSDAVMEITIRLSDHPSNEMKDGAVIKKGNLTRTFIVREIGDAIRVRARNGIEHEWSDLDRNEHQIPLINGEDAVLEGNVVIDGKKSEYYIHPSMEKAVGDTIWNIKSDAMKYIIDFIRQTDA